MPSPLSNVGVVDTDGDGKPTVSGQTDPNAVVTITDPAGGTHTVAAGPDGTFSLEIDPAPSPLTGPYTVTTVDGAGNSSAPVIVTETDLTAPVISGFDAADDSVLALLDRVRDEVAVNVPPAFNRFPHQFSHIFAGGYGAGYYSYKWAEVLSADAYEAFEEAPARVADTGARFRREVLARGGSRAAADNFRAFRGRAPRIDALLRHSGMAG